MPSEVYHPAMDWWSQGKWDAFQDPIGTTPASLPEIKVTEASSPWTLPLPPPANPGCLTFEDALWECHSASSQSDWTSEPRYVQLDGEPFGTDKKKAWSEPRPSDAGHSKANPPVLQNDPGLSGQRLKRVLHVKQAPIYKYAEWCVYWIDKGGRTSEDPITPRSELTKSEFDVQYGAWRKALVEGPPRSSPPRSAPRILELNEHVR
mmetsp:Transcript_104717/g.249336  ORF Transcript_104717/g.249336 Transcript_104717/m.249336 type:complete len:206 (-) Transcript_104717:204-821(-)